MAPWARMAPIDEVKPSFDVFPLGKVLWSMLSGQPVLHYWYFNTDPRYDLTNLFPKSSAMHLINERIFAATIVEREKDCLADAHALLERVEEVLDTITSDGQILSDSGMRCLVCGRGSYKLLFAKKHEHLRILPVAQLPGANRSPQYGQVFADGNWITVRVHSCSHCGHVALFQFLQGEAPAGWRGRK